MELLQETDLMTLWLTQYGSMILFVLLSLGILALPIPEETLMVMAGVLMHKMMLSIPLTILFSYAGAICGITMSYFLGRTAGSFVIKKYGRWIGITDHRLAKASQWFARLGKWLLCIGYFIPGIRHVTGFSAGTTNMRFSQFALYAYSGAIVWVSLFLSLGYFLGIYCIECYEKLEKFDLLALLLFLFGIAAAFLLIRKKIKAQARNQGTSPND
jgi:membrane protein DedA with SNARE-associated domain